MEELPLGCRYLEGEVKVVEEEVEGDRQVPGDERTALILRDIANTVCPHTRLTVDFPSAHSSGWMPLLDLQVKMSEDKTVDWKLFKKSLASPFFVLNRSAVASKVKGTMLIQEGIRRLRNTRPRLVERYRKELLEDMAEMMLRSGYPEQYRAGVLQAVITGYERQVEASERGEKPLYRPREWMEEERRKRKRLKRAAWFRPADTVLFLPVTPGSHLANTARSVVEEEGKRLGIKVRVVERAGTSLK